MIRVLALTSLVVIPALALGLPLEGAWEKTCQNFDGGSALEKLEIVNGLWTRTVRNFSVPDCVEPWLESREVFWTDLGNSTLDMTWKSVGLRPMNPEVAGAFREHFFCDTVQWTSMEWTDVSGEACGGLEMPAPGRMTFSIYNLTEPDLDGHQSLWLGDPTTGYDGTSISHRHIIYESSAFRRTLRPSEFSPRAFSTSLRAF